MVFCADGELSVIVGAEQVTAPPLGPVTTHDMDPAGVSPDDPVTTTESVEVPPSEVAVLVMALIVGVRVEIPTVTVLDATAM